MSSLPRTSAMVTPLTCPLEPSSVSVASPWNTLSKTSTLRESVISRSRWLLVRSVPELSNTTPCTVTFSRPPRLSSAMIAGSSGSAEVMRTGASVFSRNRSTRKTS